MRSVALAPQFNVTGGAQQAEPVRDRIAAFFGPYIGGAGAVRLNLGCARNHEPGFLNLDLSPNVDADVVCDLNNAALPFPADSFDCIFGSHVFEHIEPRAFIPLVGDLHRILKPGGFLISVTPYCSSDDAVDNPFHTLYFSESTWHYADRRLYAREGHAGYGDFGVTWDLPVIETRLIPYPDLQWKNDDDLEFARRHYRNVIQELHVVMQKPGGDR